MIVVWRRVVFLEVWGWVCHILVVVWVWEEEGKWGWSWHFGVWAAGTSASHLPPAGLGGSWVRGVCGSSTVGNSAEGFFFKPSYSQHLSPFMGSTVFLFQPLRGLLFLLVPALCAGPGAGCGEAAQMHGAVWSQEGKYHSWGFLSHAAEQNDGSDQKFIVREHGMIAIQYRPLRSACCVFIETSRNPDPSCLHSHWLRGPGLRWGGWKAEMWVDADQVDLLQKGGWGHGWAAFGWWPLPLHRSRRGRELPGALKVCPSPNQDLSLEPICQNPACLGKHFSSRSFLGSFAFVGRSKWSISRSRLLAVCWNTDGNTLRWITTRCDLAPLSILHRGFWSILRAGLQPEPYSEKQKLP